MNVCQMPVGEVLAHGRSFLLRAEAADPVAPPYCEEKPTQHKDDSSTEKVLRPCAPSADQGFHGFRRARHGDSPALPPQHSTSIASPTSDLPPI